MTARAQATAGQARADVKARVEAAYREHWPQVQANVKRGKDESKWDPTTKQWGPSIVPLELSIRNGAGQAPSIGYHVLRVAPSEVAGSWDKLAEMGLADLPCCVERLNRRMAERAKQQAKERLAAQAPEMLAVLSDVRAFWADGDAPADLMARIEAVLAAARGEK